LFSGSSLYLFNSKSKIQNSKFHLFSPVAVPIAAAGMPAPKPATIASVLPAAPAESTPARKSVII